MTEQSPQRTALITGASRGLGLALARALADEGWTLILDARGEDALESARAELSARTSVVAIPGDVSDPGHRAPWPTPRARRRPGRARQQREHPRSSPQPALLDYPLDVLEQVYRTNALAPLALIQVLRNELKPDARIINIPATPPSSRTRAGAATGRARPRWSNSPTSSPPRTRTCASTGWIPATCAPRCTRKPSPTRTSATALSPKRAFQVSWS